MHVRQFSENLSMVKPYWLRRNLSYSKDYFITRELLQEFNLNTVCEEAACPNIGECWGRSEATFIILGKSCTRNCLFCNVNNNKPEPSPFFPGRGEPVDEEEPFRIAQAVKQLQLDYVVVTSVTRDDLVDGGAGQFRGTVKAIKSLCPSAIIEILIPEININTEVDVIGHNIEMVERLYPFVRPQANYRKSLNVLKNLKGLVKSAMMVGLGEEWNEIIQTLEDLREVGVSIVHIGQYLRPSERNFPVSRYYTPQEFEDIGKVAKGLGFKAVNSGPLVRSSYRARESYESCNVL